MFRKSLTVFAAVAMLSAPLASYAQQAGPRPTAPKPQAPAAAPRGPGLDAVVAVGALVILAGLLAHRH